jgi:hypothetical protein
MNMKTTMSRFGIASFAFGMLAMAGSAQAQGLTGNTSLGLTVPPEASLTITDTATPLTTADIFFGTDFTGTTNFTYKIRTGTATTAKITLAVTADFNSTAQPKIASLPTTDTLTFTCTATAASGSGCASAQNVNALNSPKTVVTFGDKAHSSKAGDTGSVIWNLTNDPIYEVGAFTATVLFTISAA